VPLVPALVFISMVFAFWCYEKQTVTKLMVINKNHRELCITPVKMYFSIAKLFSIFNYEDKSHKKEKI
jgi:ABC-type uncharacterized transport system permease subunit